MQFCGECSLGVALRPQESWLSETMNVDALGGGGRGRCLYKWWERTNQVGEHPAGAVGRREGQHEKELRAGDVEQKQLLSVILVLAFFQAAPTSP